MFRRKSQIFGLKQANIYISSLMSDRKVNQTRNITLTSCRHNTAKQEEKLGEDDEGPYGGFGYNKKVIPPCDYQKSIRYMDSAAFRQTYGDERVWFRYKRNYKGNIVPKPRLTCTHKEKWVTNNPCPVCRDIYLIVDYRHPKLLKHFLEPNSTKLVDNQKTGVCRRQQFNLKMAVAKAIDQGYMEGHVPFREYDMDYYYSLLDDTESEEEEFIPVITDPEEKDRFLRENPLKFLEPEKFVLSSHFHATPEEKLIERKAKRYKKIYEEYNRKL